MSKRDTRYDQLLRQLQAMDFVLIELNLYLDTHPDDVDAIRQFNQQVQERWQIAREFENHYGPLTSIHSYSRYPWQWKDTPWPWQV